MLPPLWHPSWPSLIVRCRSAFQTSSAHLHSRACVAICWHLIRLTFWIGKFCKSSSSRNHLLQSGQARVNAFWHSNFCQILKEFRPKPHMSLYWIWMSQGFHLLEPKVKNHPLPNYRWIIELVRIGYRSFILAMAAQSRFWRLLDHLLPRHSPPNHPHRISKSLIFLTEPIFAKVSSDLSHCQCRRCIRPRRLLCLKLTARRSQHVSQRSLHKNPWPSYTC